MDVVDGKADDVLGIVEFRATYLTAPGDGVLVLHERSRFVQEGSRWYYLPGCSASLAAAMAWPAAARAWVMVASPRAQARACSIT